MKRTIPVIFILISLTIVSFGQMKGGLKAGANLSRIIVTKSGEDLNNPYSSRISFHAGSYLQQPFNDYLLWQVELLFSNKGYKTEINGETVNVSLNYLNWPIMLIYRPAALIEFEVGPELGYMISGEEILNSFDCGIDFGVRFNINQKLNSGFRYNYGFPFKMDLEETSAEGTDVTYQNSVFQIYLGFNLINE